MTKTLLLLKVQLLGYFGINKLFYGSTHKDKVKAIFAGIGGILIAAILIGYSALLAVGYVMIGLAEYIPGMFVMLCALITLVFTFLKSNGTLFAFRDYDMIMSLPVSNAQVIASRLLGVYLMDLIFTAGVMIPALVVYAVNAKVGILFWVYAFFAVLVSPVLPMILAMVAGAAIAAVSSKFRKSNLLTIILSVAATLGVLVLSFGLQNTTTEIVANAGVALGNIIERYYPPSALLTGALIDGNVLSLLLFLLANLLPGAVFIAVLAKFYAKINSAMFARRTRSSYRMGAIRASTPLGALYKKELRRLVSSTIYLLNTCIGVVLMLGAAIALLVMNPAQLDAAMEMEGVSQLLRSFLPFLTTLFVIMSSTTCVSLNMEGKTRWVAISLPVESKLIFTSKILVNLTILVPGVIISNILIILRFSPDFFIVVLMFLMPLAYSVFIAVLGLVMNLAFPKYDWSSEQQAVKQSISTVVTIFIGFISVAIPFLVVMFLPSAAAYGVIGSVVVTVGAAMLLYRKLSNTRLYV